MTLRYLEAKRDHYRKLAKKEGFRSRAAYKLLQMDKRNDIIPFNGIVIDFGAAPGGWMQVASEKVGDNGLVLGMDIKNIRPISKNTVSLTIDVFNAEIGNEIMKIIPDKADVVLSDIAPDIIGVWQVDHLKQIDMVMKIIALFPTILKPNGNAVLKIFEGEDTQNTLIHVRKLFQKIHISKPPASRGKSSELYFVCLKYKNVILNNELNQ